MDNISVDVVFSAIEALVSRRVAKASAECEILSQVITARCLALIRGRIATFSVFR